jgi:ABC-type dipeptide/oligopeptide/nickel transport system permease component
MLQYVVRRLLQFIPVFFGVTLILFFITTILPGDPVQLKAGEKALNPELRAQIAKEYGLDQPWYIQYGNYMVALLPVHVRDGNVTFDGPDLGVSINQGRRVATIISETYPYTIELALAAIAIEIVMGLGAGIVSAVRQYSFWDVAVTLSTSILVSLPVFWLGLLLQYTFGIWLKQLTNGAIYLPISGASGEPFADWVYLILPAITLASVSTAYVARIMRSQLLEVNGQDYIRTAYAKGLSGRGVLFSHSLKNALIPVITFIGLDLGAMLSGAILTETVFNWPGIGYTIYRAISLRDYPVVFGGVVVILFAIMIVNLVVDISYGFLDPRIRYGGEGD